MAWPWQTRKLADAFAGLNNEAACIQSYLFGFLGERAGQNLLKWVEGYGIIMSSHIDTYVSQAEPRLTQLNDSLLGLLEEFSLDVERAHADKVKRKDEEAKEATHKVTQALEIGLAADVSIPMLQELQATRERTKAMTIAWGANELCRRQMVDHLQQGKVIRGSLKILYDTCIKDARNQFITEQLGDRIQTLLKIDEVPEDSKGQPSKKRRSTGSSPAHSEAQAAQDGDGNETPGASSSTPGAKKRKFE